MQNFKVFAVKCFCRSEALFSVVLVQPCSSHVFWFCWHCEPVQLHPFQGFFRVEKGENCDVSATRDAGLAARLLKLKTVIQVILCRQSDLTVSSWKSSGSCRSKKTARKPLFQWQNHSGKKCRLEPARKTHGISDFDGDCSDVGTNFEKFQRRVQGKITLFPTMPNLMCLPKPSCRYQSKIWILSRRARSGDKSGWK